MKPFYLLLICFFAFTLAAKAQTTDTTKAMSSEMSSAKVFGGTSQYNTWSVGINAGVTSAQVPFMVNSSDDWHAALGYGVDLRDQISHSLSIRLDYNGGKVVGSVDQVSNTGAASTTTIFGGTYFSTKFNSVNLSGVVDIGSISFLHRQSGIILYASAGLGIDFYKPSFSTAPGATSATTTYANTVKELDAPLGTGLKFKLTDALDLNIGYTVTLVNNYNFSGYKFYPSLAGHYAYTYAGLEYTFGSSAKKSLEWVNPVAMMYDELYDAALRQEVEALKGRVTNVETAVADLKKDSDGDGVSDQFDKCPNTPAGTVVDGSGCPIVFPKADTLKGLTEMKTAAPEENIIRFGPGKAVILNPGLLDEIISHLKLTKNIKLQLIGRCSRAEPNHYHGTPAHDKYMMLSDARIKAVTTYLAAHGISANRLVTQSFGVSKPYNMDDFHPDAQVDNRSVEFELIFQ